MMRNNLFIALLTGLMVGPVFAQVPDPTRPPGGQDPTGGATAPLDSGIQTVILRPGGQSAAVINGQYLRVGDKFGDKRVLKISESEVVLQGGNGREVLKLTPAIEKVSVKKNAARKSPAKEAAHQ